MIRNMELCGKGERRTILSLKLKKKYFKKKKKEKEIKKEIVMSNKVILLTLN